MAPAVNITGTAPGLDGTVLRHVRDKKFLLNMPFLTWNGDSAGRYKKTGLEEINCCAVISSSPDWLFAIPDRMAARYALCLTTESTL